MDNDRVYDELLNFLGDPLFQIPVRTYMDENCLIFDQEMPTTDEHKECHAKYKKLIDALLGNFCLDLGISVTDAVLGITRMNDIPDIKEVFQVLFEQILGADNFDIFYQVMVRRNIDIQEQVLVMIIAATGAVPSSFALDHQGESDRLKCSDQLPHQTSDKQEEEVLQQVIRTSKVEHERHKKAMAREKAELERTLELSKAEAATLQKERQIVTQNLHQMTAGSSQSPAETADTAQNLHQMTAGSSQSPAETADTAQKLERMTLTSEAVKGSTMPSAPPVSAPKGASKKTPAAPVSRPPLGELKAPPSGKGASSADAASAWMQSAQAEAQSTTHKAISAGMVNMTPEELQARQKYLSEQRDRLLAMKKEARAKQLGDAVKSQPQRPRSARAARSAMDQPSGKSTSEEDEKKIAMRRAIADKLRQEVIGN